MALEDPSAGLEELRATRVAGGRLAATSPGGLRQWAARCSGRGSSQEPRHAVQLASGRVRTSLADDSSAQVSTTPDACRSSRARRGSLGGLHVEPLHGPAARTASRGSAPRPHRPLCLPGTRGPDEDSADPQRQHVRDSAGRFTPTPSTASTSTTTGTLHRRRLQRGIQRAHGRPAASDCLHGNRAGGS